jgi:dimethylsulfoniopropionate demethylase
MTPNIFFSRRIRKTPFEDRVYEQGVKGFTVYNQMPLATSYTTVEDDYWHLREHVQLWDVACERQVEVRGPDALKLIQLSTPRDISKCAIGQCVYAPLCDEDGGIVNDPLLLRFADDHFWVSIADSGVLLWLKGLAAGLSLDVEVSDPDIGPCALQGPKADAVMQSLLDIDVHTIKFFRFVEVELAGVAVVVARSGWSGQGGYEIYLKNASHGLALWDAIWEAGEAHDIRAGCPNLIERIESGLLSYGNDMTNDNNIFECGLDRFITLGKQADYLSREALDKISRDGTTIKLVNLEFDGGPTPPLRATWPVYAGDEQAGILTSAAWSPRLERNIAFASVGIEYANTGQALGVKPAGEPATREATVVPPWRGS